jgi:thymidine kinase
VSKLYFRFGCMDSSKTARLLMDAHEYKKRGEFPLLLKPVLDTRSSKGMIESRVGLSAPCVDMKEDFNIYDFVAYLINNAKTPAVIFVDEAQFLTFAQALQLRLIANNFKIPVMCYGLKTDFRGRLFAGSQALFELANRYEEVKTICRQEGCSNKAMFNGRFKDGEPVFEGETVAVGDTKKSKDKYYYIPKCSQHFFEDYVRSQKAKKEKEKSDETNI